MLGVLPFLHPGRLLNSIRMFQTMDARLSKQVYSGMSDTGGNFFFTKLWCCFCTGRQRASGWKDDGRYAWERKDDIGLWYFEWPRPGTACVEICILMVSGLWSSSLFDVRLDFWSILLQKLWMVETRFGAREFAWVQTVGNCCTLQRWSNLFRWS